VLQLLSPAQLACASLLLLLLLPHCSGWLWTAMPGAASWSMTSLTLLSNAFRTSTSTSALWVAYQSLAGIQAAGRGAWPTMLLSESSSHRRATKPNRRLVLLKEPPQVLKPMV
jgi:hypothetical protein